MGRLTSAALILLFTSPFAFAGKKESARLSQIVEVRKIWDAGNHNAFTSLVRFKEEWFCAFREGKAHVAPDGAIRVLRSKDGLEWTAAARITDPHADLRDPKLCITPDGRLMINAVAATPKEEVRHRSMVWFSKDGFEWGDPTKVGDDNFWLWRVTWNGDVAYGVGYLTAADRSTRFSRLYKSTDGGATFQPLVDKLLAEGSPGESSLLFDADGTAHCLVRRDTGKATALFGIAKPPYTEWTWQDLGVRIGGPAIIRLKDGRLIAVVRLYNNPVRTAVCQIDETRGTLKELFALPSGGDCSYAGLVEHEGILWISYYSSHEGKTAIYLAKVDLSK